MAPQQIRDEETRQPLPPRDWALPADATQQSFHEVQILQTKHDPLFTASWRSLFAFITREHTRSIVCAILITVIAGILKPAAAIFYGKIFTSLANFGSGLIGGKETLHEVSIWCIALTSLGIAAWIVEGALLSSWIIFGELQAKTVRQQMFAGMLDREMEWYDLREDGVGSLLIRIQTQIRELQLALSQPLGLVVFEFVGTLASLAIAFYYSWNLTLVITATFPVAAIVIYFISVGLAPAIEAQKRELSQASKYANTAVLGIDTVKAFNAQEHEAWQYYTTMQKVTTFYLKQARANALQFGVTKFLLVGIFVLGFWYGVFLASKGLSPGSVLTTFYSCLSAFLALETILPQWLVLSKGISAGAMLKSIMDRIQREKTIHMDGSIKPTTQPGNIEINDLSFAYPSNARMLVLNRVNFFFPSGETTFLVGSSGSGKSTVGNLIMKYYEPLAGEIIVNGQALQLLDTNWLRQNITLVQQDNVLFNETIFQNIAFGKRDHTRIEVMRASRVGCLQDTLRDMPDGIDTLVGSNGRALSGGQKQRVAIARAALRDSAVLILDESTSALDHRGRLEVMNAIREWRRGKTTIIITHDLSQIQDNDYVYVLDKARVVQEGYRRKLADKSRGIFASILRGEDRPVGQIRRQSEPASPSLETPRLDEFATPRPGYAPRLFETQEPPLEPIRMSMSSHRMSIGVAVAQTNGLRSKLIWSSPVIPEDEAQLPNPKNPPSSINRKPSLSFFPKRQPSTRFLSPRAAPHIPSQTTRLQNIQSSQFQSHFPSSSTSGSPHVSKTSTFVPKDIKRTSSAVPINLLPTSEGTSTSVVNSNRNNKHAPLWKVFRTILPKVPWLEKILFISGFLSAIIVAAATPAFAYIFARLLNTFYMTENQLSEARKWALTLVAVAISDGVFSFCTHYFLEYSGQVWINSLRVEALDRILVQPKSWFDQEEHSSHRLNDCLDRNGEEMRNLVGRFAGPIFTVIIMLGISITWAFVIAWDLTLVALGCGPVMYGIIRGFSFVSGRWEHKCNRVAQIASSIFTETFSNIRVVRALTLEAYLERKHRVASVETYKVGLRRAWYSGLLFGLTDSITLFIIAVVFYYGAVLVTRGSRSVGSILEVINLLLLGVANSSAILAMVPQISSSRTTATQMLHLASLPRHASHETSGALRISTPFPLQITNLSFTYPNSVVKTLSRISFTLESGTCTAIVGSSGSGKSTIASIILGLYPPDAQLDLQDPPPLTFNGISIGSCNMVNLRSFISIVPQTPVLFPATILDNIFYGLPEGSDFRNIKYAEKAATQAGIHTFISSLEEGYDTVVGEGGMGLSGGQAQRIAISRALVRRPQLLILDEATSALDKENADSIKGLIRSLSKEGMSVLMISHDIQMMRIADCIIVVESGHIVEIGRFEELERSGGAFARLVGEKPPDVGLGLVVEDGSISPVKARNRQSWQSRSVG